jgi:hypothetical protein
MTTAQEAAAAKTQLAGDLAAGVATLSLNQQVTFYLYRRVVLPLDGYVFWVRASLLGPSAILNGSPLDTFRFDQPQGVRSPAPSIVATGSLHYATSRGQEEDQTTATNQVVFTSLVPVQDLNLVGPSAIYIATLQPDNVRFAFANRRSFYQQADLYHYVGNAVYASMATQVIDDPRQFWGRSPIVSNSLPLWLALNGYQPPPGSLAVPLTLYASYVVPDNLQPPYGVVHIPPESTRAMQSTPYLGGNLSHDQLARDLVRVTLWGERNFNALDFLDAVNQYSLDTDNIGIMNMPIVRDEKKPQVELAAIAMKKTIEFEVSYYQSTARTVARQIITQCVPSFVLQP